MKATPYSEASLELLEVRIGHHKRLAASGNRTSAVYVEELQRELTAAREAERQERAKYNYHAFVDESKRRPYRCGVCGRDIKDAYHQPTLYAGMVFELAEEAERKYAEPWPEEEPSPQMDLFTFDKVQP